MDHPKRATGSQTQIATDVAILNLRPNGRGGDFAVHNEQATELHVESDVRSYSGHSFRPPNR